MDDFLNAPYYGGIVPSEEAFNAGIHIGNFSDNTQVNCVSIVDRNDLYIGHFIEGTTHYWVTLSKVSTFGTRIVKEVFYSSNAWRSESLNFTETQYDSVRGIYYCYNGLSPSSNIQCTVYTSLDDLLIAFVNFTPVSPSYPIIYRLTNATTAGPNEAVVGDTVIVPLTFPEGYGVVNPSTDVYVTCNGESVPSTYFDGQLVFTMPDPS